MAHKRKLAAVLFSLGCLQAGSVWALGLGEMTLESFLNEPLKAKVDLLNTGGLHSDEIRVRLATAEDFDRMGVDRAYFLTGITFEVSVDSDGQGVILISSDDPVLEPYLDLIVETRWPSGRLLREYTVLIDPPAFDNSNPVISASERVYEVEGIPAEPAKKKEDPAAATSGTRVDVRKSDLAPGDMPQRDFSADTSPYPQAGSRYMIKRDETLWNIALAGKPEGVSVHQAMLDIQRLNPDAFIDGNINRIKAGYIVYLPTEGDISSDDLASALAEVSQQNDDWRAGRASEAYGGGPKLRISVDDDMDGGSDAGDSDSSGDRDSAAASNVAMEEMDRAVLESGDLQGQVDAMSQQVETLERIVSVKDEQIAALQAALEEAQAGADSAADDSSASADMDGTMMAAKDSAEEAAAVEPVVEPEAVAAPPPTAAPVPAPAPPVKEESGGLFGNLLYIGGALVLAILAGLFFWRRRNTDAEVETVDSVAAARPRARDAFEGVQLKEQEVEVAPADVPAPEESAEEAAAAANRGYGEEKHDEYASDADTGDALAEADIYIAYGRYPQAADLLKTAISSEPDNADYRLKLLELSLEMGEPGEAEKQLAELQSMGNTEALAKAESLMSGSAEPAVTEAALGAADTALEADFGELELDDGSGDAQEDDLDLTKDFASEENGDEMVFAAEGNTMSTKLDLARAYMDMGDEDGARQILEEVAADGDAEQQQEARTLLERLG